MVYKLIRKEFLEDNYVLLCDIIQMAFHRALKFRNQNVQINQKEEGEEEDQDKGLNYHHPHTSI